MKKLCFLVYLNLNFVNEVWLNKTKVFYLLKNDLKYSKIYIIG